MPAKRVREYLENNGVIFESIFHTSTYTSQRTAEETHIKGQDLVKAVVVKADGKYIVVAAPSSRRVDLSKVRKAVGAAEVRLADESVFGELFPGCELGAMPPLGKLFNLELWADNTIREDDQVAFNAGTHKEVLRIGFIDYKRLELPKFADLVV